MFSVGPSLFHQRRWWSLSMHVYLCVCLSHAPFWLLCLSVCLCFDSCLHRFFDFTDCRLSKENKEEHGRASCLERAICTWDPPKWLLLHQGTHVSGLSSQWYQLFPSSLLLLPLPLSPPICYPQIFSLHYEHFSISFCIIVDLVVCLFVCSLHSSLSLNR